MSVSQIPKGVLAALRRWEKVDLISRDQAEGLRAPRVTESFSPFYLLDLAADGPRAPRVVH